MEKIHFSRRRMLLGLGASGMLARFGWMNALAQSSSPGYKALVCIFLQGGNDGHNTIVPLSAAGFNAYKAARGSLALPDSNGPLGQVVAKDGSPYGLNPGLAALLPLWNSGKFGVMANVGMLVQPTSRAQYVANSVKVPTNLFSHADQQQQMQSGIPSSSGGSGWGGRAADQVQAMNGASTFPTAFSIAGPALFCTGSVIQSAALLPGFNLDVDGMSLWPQAATDARKLGYQQILQFNSGLSLIQAANKTRQDALALNAMLTNATSSLKTVFPGTSIGAQLQQVAAIMNLRASTGMNRQVFFCALGGFDTHGSQSWQQYDLLQQVSQAMVAFYQATQEMSISDSVTTFTLSDFGRTLQPSGTGSDHGWGNHHLVMGDSVQGGTVFGAFPDLSLGGPDDSGTRGALIPSTSVDQFGATLAAWLGVPAAQLPAVFPNIGNFGSNNLGFLG
jgi:uncharacterized protein (DUF1501 family)